MPWELIYTSAQRGLISGQSGFCTVARTADLRESLAQRIEQISSYHYVEYAGASARRNPVISAYRVLDLRGTKFHVLSRILPCGLDFTARTNHLAHHLIFTAEELGGLPSPATILLHWSGWRSGWSGEPRLLEPLPADSFSRLPGPAWPAATWQQMTGDAGRAAGLLESDLCRGSHLLTPAGEEHSLLQLFAETLHLLNPAGKTAPRAWLHPFTTFLQGEDVPADFQWRGCQAGTPAHAQALQRAVTPVALKAIRVPNNELARLAREGPRLPVVAPAAGSAPPLTFRRPPVRTPLDALKLEQARRQKQADEGFNISISMKSLIGIGIAVLLLLGLLGAKHFWSGHATPPRPQPRPEAAVTPPATEPDKPETNKPEPLAPPTNVVQTTVPSPVSPTPEPPKPAAPAVPELSAGKATRLLSGIVPEVPTYLFLVTDPCNSELGLSGVTPLVKMLQLFGHYNLKPNEVSLRYYLNPGDSAGLFQHGVEAFVKSSPNEHTLFVQGGGQHSAGTGFLFDYSSFPATPGGGETVRLQARLPEFSPDQRAALGAFALVFGPATTGPGARSAGVDSFGVAVIDPAKPPRPVRLTDQFLRVNEATLEATLQEPLRNRIKQFLLPAGASWQLRPYVTNAAGTQVRDLYDQLPPEVRPAAGGGLDFARDIRFLAAKLADSSQASDRLQKQMDAANAVAIPPVKWDLPVGTLLGLTNKPELLSFNAFLTVQTNVTVFSPLFLKYIGQLAAAARPQQAWLGNWPDQPGWDDLSWQGSHFETVLKQLRVFYSLCASNLPPEAGAKLAEGMGPESYFVVGWEWLMRREKLQQLKNEKDIADYNVKHWQGAVDLMPDRLDKVDHVRLILRDANNQAVELIRFTERTR